MPGYLDKEEKRLALKEAQRKRDEQKNAEATDATGEGEEIVPNEKDVTKLNTEEVRGQAEEEDDDDDNEQFEESTGEPTLVEKKTK